MKKGKNDVAIIGKTPFYPMVDFIKLSLNSLNAGIPDKIYQDFYEKLKTNNLFDEHSCSALHAGTNSSSSDEVSLRRGTGNEMYYYHVNMTAYYTTYLHCYWNAGHSVTLTTSQTGSFGHVIHVFDDCNPLNSWVSSSFGNGSLTLTTKHTGHHLIVVRSYTPFTSGTLNLTLNGGWYNNIPVTNSGMAVTDTYSTPRNYFTCKLKGGYTWLFLEEAGSPGRIVGDDDEGGIKSDGYKWLHASLLYTSQQARYVFLTQFSSSVPSSICDFYLGLERPSSNVFRQFPNLATDNSFKSDISTPSYNCHSYAVGETTFSQILNTVTDADNFFGIYKYTRTGANATNGAIALWVSTNTGAVLHSSVTKNSTIQNPHGFEWESKLGYNERVMHTRDALTDGPYGSIAYYYKPINGTINYSKPIDENEADSSVSTRSSVAQQSLLNQTIRTESRFTQSELNQISYLKSRIPEIVINEFYLKCSEWKKTWSRPEISIHSNSRKYAESVEYENLIKFSLKYGKALLPLVFELLENGESMTINLLEDLTFPENRQIYDDIKTDFYRKVDVRKTIPSTVSILIEYSKYLLSNEYETIFKMIETISIIEKNNLEPNVISITNQEIVFNLYSDKESTAILNIYNSYGTNEYNSIYNLSKGEQNIVINACKFMKGIYIIQITIGSNIYTKKINLY